MARPQGRLPELDFVKAIAILAVVWIHASGEVVPSSAPPLSNPLNATVTLARFAVPAFVMLSGLALRLRYGGEQVDRGAFLRRRWVRVLVPWAAWAAFYVLFSLWVGRAQPDPGWIAGWLRLGPLHLYFLLLIAQLYAVFAFLPRRAGHLAVAAAALLGLQVALDAWRTFGPLPDPGSAFVSSAFVLSPFWAGYFALGCLAGAVYPRLRARLRPGLPVLAALVAGAAVLGLGQLSAHSKLQQSTFAYLWPAAVPFAVAMTLALLAAGASAWSRLPQPVRRPALWLGANSLGVYATHLAPLILASIATRGDPGWLRLAAMLAAGLGGGVGLTLLLKRSPLAPVIGETAPRREPALRRRIALG